MVNRLALFDCDGTLVDSQHSIFVCVEEAFARAGLASPGRLAARRVVGLSLLPAMTMLAPHGEAELHEQLAEDYKAAFQRLRRAGLVEEPLFDGIVEALDMLQDDGWILGVATGKSDRGLDLCLRQHGLRERFLTLQTADRHPSKPHPSMAHRAMADAGAVPETTVMIGDTSFDMAMGVAAGTRAIGVDWGYHPREELLAAGASQVIAHARELKEAIS